MKNLWAVALLLFIGGCLPAPTKIVTHDAAQAIPANPTAATLAADSVTPAASFTIPPSFSTAVTAVPTSRKRAVLSPVTAADAVLSSGPLAADVELLAEEVPADPETMEDLLILTGKGQAPPEDEGQTVATEVSFDFPVVKNDKVLYYVDYFSGTAKNVFKRWLERSARYLPMMQQTFAEEGLPLDLVYLAMIESGFNNRAYSWAHAAGPWQFIEGTGRLYGLSNDWWRDERRDPVKATRAAARHLKDLHKMFDGDWYLAVAAYNAGSGKIRRAVEMYQTRDFWELSHGSYLKPETKNYLPKLLAALLIAKEPVKYGFDTLNYLSPLAFDTVTVPTTTDLEIIAKSSDSNVDAIKELNPELKRWSTPPGVTDYSVRIPVGTQDVFLAQYALVPANRRASFHHHKVKSGDTLLAIAKRYGIRVDDIVTLNKISNPRALRVGADLILPLQKGGGANFSEVAVADDYQRSRRPAPQTYKVRSGDNLWSIAKRLNVSQKDLQNWNKLNAKSVLRPGQTLVVSASGSKQHVASTKNQAKRSVAKQTNTSKPASKKSEAPRKVVYKVQPGDTLFAIGRQFKVAARQIMVWNNLSENHILQPGDRLTLMVQGDHRS